jgi:hypothetical protein
VRGFQPPIFADIRLRRQGRAKGFVGDAFRDLVGSSRYHWMNDLGNACVASGKSGIEIKRPEAAVDLLNLARRAAKDHRRVIFYCACEFPWCEGKRWCHRDKVTELLLAEAKTAGRAVSITEWPGGEPLDARLKVDHELYLSVMNGRMSIPFDRKRLSDYAALPWGSILTLESDQNGETGLVAVGPASFAASKIKGGEWRLPVFYKPKRERQSRHWFERFKIGGVNVDSTSAKRRGIKRGGGWPTVGKETTVRQRVRRPRIGILRRRVCYARTLAHSLNSGNASLRLPIATIRRWRQNSHGTAEPCA